MFIFIKCSYLTLIIRKQLYVYKVTNKFMKLQTSYLNERISSIIKYSYLIIIIIILPCHHHGYPWPSLATPPYRSSVSAGPQGYNMYPHRAAVYRFELVTLLLFGHVKESIGVYHLWARPCFSSSVLHVWFV